MRTPDNKKIGTVYLIHFALPLHHARHYIGFTELVLAERIQRHRDGNGSRLLRALKDAGIDFDAVRTWENVPQPFETELKRRKNASRLCPVCKEKRK